MATYFFQLNNMRRDIQNNDTQDNDIQHNSTTISIEHNIFAECHLCHVTCKPIMLSITMLYVVMLSVTMVNGLMLSVVIMNVVMLSVTAPKN
jgi:hypothetical protein